MIKGFDAAHDLSRFASCLVNEGFNFVCRYYNINNPAKNLTFAEANYLTSAGLRIVTVWENGFPTISSYFSHQKGIADGTAAYEYASNVIKQPSGTPIYFAVDYDASQTDINDRILSYFEGIIEGFGHLSSTQRDPVYLIGVYGSGLVCKSLLAANKVTYTWLAQSQGWRGYKTFTQYNIKQLKQTVECSSAGSIQGDPDESPNDNEGSFQITHLTDFIVRNKLLNAVEDEESLTRENFRRLTLAEMQAKIKNNNNSPFSDGLVLAICWLESSFKPEAKNPSSTATGLMMMTKPAIDTTNANIPAGIHFAHSEMTDPDKAIAAGTWYLNVIFKHEGTGDKAKTLKRFGDGTDSYATKIITCESCLQSVVVGNEQSCLDAIHT